MSPALFAGLVLFALVCSATPGPNTLMLSASGAAFGVRRSAPHVAGVVLGLGAMTALLGLAVVWTAAAAPWLYLALRWAAAAYLLSVAWRMLRAKGPGVGVTDGEPVSLLGAAMFQWVNPRAWAMALFAASAYAGRGRPAEVALIAVVFMLVTAPCALVWTARGADILRWLKPPARLKAFNAAAAALLVLSLCPLALWPLSPPAS